MLGLRVMTVEGRRMSRSKAFARAASHYLSDILFYCGYIMALFTEKRQALHDLIAGTIVVE